MKAKLLALASLASLFVLNGCNGIGDKDSILARINKEKVFVRRYENGAGKGHKDVPILTF